jgi:hypothetical protein
MVNPERGLGQKSRFTSRENENVLEYLVVNRIIVKRIIFKWFKLR